MVFRYMQTVSLKKMKVVFPGKQKVTLLTLRNIKLTVMFVYVFGVFF